MLPFKLLFILLCSVALSALALAVDVPLSQQILAPDPVAAELDHPRLRDADQSLISWKNMNTEEWLNARLWIQERDQRDLDPLWRVKPRLKAIPEQVGKVISCIGTCTLRRGLGLNRIRYLSRVVEGDEIVTQADSYVWLMLTDGTLVRVAPESSLAIMEMNVSTKKFFFHARLNHGFVYWKPRDGREMVVSDLTETDRLFLPVLDLEANLEWFQRNLYQKASEQEKFNMTSGLSILGQKQMYEHVNALIRENNAFHTLDHEALLVSPNASVLSINRELTMFYNPRGSSYLLSKSKAEFDTGPGRERNTASVYFRGFTNTESVSPETEQWREMNPAGTALTVMENVPPLLAASEILTKRIPTLLHIREKWLAQTKGLWGNLDSAEKMATNWGVRLWGEELDKRLEYLQEYTRRVETSNLRSLERFVKQPGPEFDGRFFSRALDAYFGGIKRRYSHGNTSVLDMIPLHYHGWVLINARQ